jgi:hypothetical protein
LYSRVGSRACVNWLGSPCDRLRSCKIYCAWLHNYGFIGAPGRQAPPDPHRAPGNPPAIRPRRRRHGSSLFCQECHERYLCSGGKGRSSIDVQAGGPEPDGVRTRCHQTGLGWTGPGGQGSGTGIRASCAGPERYSPSRSRGGRPGSRGMPRAFPLVEDSSLTSGQPRA